MWRQKENEEDQRGQGYDLGNCLRDKRERGARFRSGCIEQVKEMRAAINMLAIRRVPSTLFGTITTIFILSFFFFFLPYFLSRNRSYRTVGLKSLMGATLVGFPRGRYRWVRQRITAEMSVM